MKQTRVSIAPIVVPLPHYVRQAQFMGFRTFPLGRTYMSAVAGLPVMLTSQRIAAPNSPLAPLPTANCGTSVSLPTMPCTMYRPHSA